MQHVARSACPQIVCVPVPCGHSACFTQTAVHCESFYLVWSGTALALPILRRRPASAERFISIGAPPSRVSRPVALPHSRGAPPSRIPRPGACAARHTASRCWFCPALRIPRPAVCAAPPFRSPHPAPQCRRSPHPAPHVTRPVPKEFSENFRERSACLRASTRSAVRLVSSQHV